MILDVIWSGRTIELKTDPEVFQDVLDERKPFELRFNDRNYQIGDDLRLKETKHTSAEMNAGAPLIFTGREVTKRVGYILRGPIYGLTEGWVIAAFSIAPTIQERASLTIKLDTSTVTKVIDEAKREVGEVMRAREMLQELCGLYRVGGAGNTRLLNEKIYRLEALGIVRRSLYPGENDSDRIQYDQRI